jgi:CBS domain-containing protein
MLIEHILAAKGRDVVTVRPTDAVARAVTTLRRHGIGAVVVSSDDGSTATGILSERDIVRALADHGPAALERPVSDVMTSDVFTCGPDASVDELMSLMTERRIRHIPIVLDGRLAGVVSIGDVVKQRVGELAEEARTLVEYVQSGR